MSARFYIAAMLFAGACATAQATPLTIVNVKASDVSCLFSKSALCAVNATNTDATIPLQFVSGKAVLRSRTFTGFRGTPGVGKTAYLFRVDLTDTRAHIGTISRLVIDFGPVTKLKYDKNSPPADVFVITSDGGGTVGLGSAEQAGTFIIFELSKPQWVGQAAGNTPGEMTHYFGLAAAAEPKATTVQVEGWIFGNPPALDVSARVPIH